METYVKSGGTYKPAVVLVKDGGVYRATSPSIKNAGVYVSNPLFQLTTLLDALGGILWMPNQHNYVNTADTTLAPLGDPVGYMGSHRQNLPENMLINSVFAGAAVGAPGTMPTGWTKAASGSGLTTEITAASVSSITIRVSGTANATTAVSLLGRTSTTEVPAKPGEIWSFSCNIATVVASGSTPTGKAQFSWAERTAAGGGVSSASLNYTEGRHIFTRVIAGATTERFDTRFNLFPVSGETYDFTVTISNIQLERGRASTYVPTTTAAISRGVFNPAFQATTANKPLLKQIGGKYNLLFDGSDDYLQTPINPTSSGYMCVAARQDEALSTSNYLFGAGKTSATVQAGVALGISATGQALLNRIDATGTNTATSSSTTTTPGDYAVLDAEYTTTTAKVRLNGAGEGTSSVTRDCANATTVHIIGGVNSGTSIAPALSNPFQGAIFGAVHIPSVPSTADQATIRKLMAQIAGVSGVI